MSVSVSVIGFIIHLFNTSGATVADMHSFSDFSTRAIRVDWVHPDELNGVLERYVLFASDTFIYEIGNEVYNSTDSFTYYNLNDLAPGTTYFIRLSVSVLNQ